MEIILSGRTDLNDFFKLSGIREYEKLNHTPFLCFIPNLNGIQVSLVYNILELLKLDDSIKVMAQWRGQWSSDFFQFNVGTLRDYLKSNPPESYHLA